MNQGTTAKNVIEKGVPNHEYYVWNIPESFTDYNHPVLLFGEDSSISVYRQPIIRILPDVNTGEITANSFYVIDGGYFISASDTSINLVLEMKDNNGVISYTGDASIKINITGNKIDETTPVTIYDPVYFPGTIDYKVIDIHIANSVNNDVVGIVQNIIII